MTGKIDDPAPFTMVQMGALLGAAARELTWALRHTARELRRWRAIAERIPDETLRADALHALDTKRGYADGAALFTSIPARRSLPLLQAVVAYETIVDYLDNVSERHPTHANGQLLHQALTDALLPGQPLTDYYRHHPSGADGGYLSALVEACRRGVERLPSIALLRPHLLREARRTKVLGLNHELDPQLRDDGLRRWAAAEFPGERELAWWELSGAQSATLHTHALFALAAEREVDERAVAAVSAAHWPWIALATTLLDSYVDLIEDRAAGAHCYLDHYPTLEDAHARTRESITTAMRSARAAPRGERHAVIVGCMVALYLSADSASSPDLRETTATFEAAGGTLVRVLVPMLRAWRHVNRQRA